MESYLLAKWMMNAIMCISRARRIKTNGKLMVKNKYEIIEHDVDIIFHMKTHFKKALNNVDFIGVVEQLYH
jgi:hypothetical protein